jgi:hypothetical protein
MALSPKLKTSNSVNEEELIRKGGSSGESNDQAISEIDEVKRVQLRIPLNYLNRIGSLLNARAGNVSRHTWIIEAIVEKLGKEENESEVKITSSQP